MRENTNFSPQNEQINIRLIHVTVPVSFLADTDTGPR